MRISAHHERRTGWRAVLDPELWRQALVLGMAGAVSMAILACAIALARDTTGHDWYAASRITAADLLIFAGFDEDAPIEYRSARGVTETISRDRLSYTFEARWAREDILDTAWNGAMLGWISGFGGALLSLVLIRRSVYEPASVQEPRPVPREERRVSAPAPVKPGFAPPPPAAAAPVRASPDRSPASGPSHPAKPVSAVARKSEPAGDKAGASSPTRRGRRKRNYGRWI